MNEKMLQPTEALENHQVSKLYQIKLLTVEKTFLKKIPQQLNLFSLQLLFL